jgi:hypothetical protein
VTAEAQENTRAAQAQAAGKDAAAQHEAAALAQHQACGSAVVVESPVTPDDQAVDWTSG